MSTRSRKEHASYLKYRKTFHKEASCVFCQIDKNDYQFVSETKSFKVIKNIFPYSTWDDQDVVDHLMIVPKSHTDTLSTLTPLEAQEYVKLMSSYEASGYNVWARAPKTVRKTIIHQHTHLIKPGKKYAGFSFMYRVPTLELHGNNCEAFFCTHS